MKQINRITSLLLALILVLSLLPTTVTADTGANYIGNGGGSVSTTSNSAYTWYSDKVGLRISIVDESGKIVTNKYNAIDVTFSELPNEMRGYYSNKIQSIYNDELKPNKVMTNTEVNKRVSNAINSTKAFQNIKDTDGSTITFTKYLEKHDRTTDIPMPFIDKGAGSYASNQENVYNYFINASTLTSYVPPVKSSNSIGRSEVSNNVYNNYTNRGASKPSNSGSSGGSNSSVSEHTKKTDKEVIAEMDSYSGPYITNAKVNEVIDGYWKKAITNYASMYSEMASMRLSTHTKMGKSWVLNPAKKGTFETYKYNYLMNLGSNRITLSATFLSIQRGEYTLEEAMALNYYLEKVEVKLGKLWQKETADLVVGGFNSNVANSYRFLTWKSFLRSSTYGTVTNVRYKGNNQTILDNIDNLNTEYVLGCWNELLQCSVGGFKYDSNGYMKLDIADDLLRDVFNSELKSAIKEYLNLTGEQSELDIAYAILEQKTLEDSSKTYADMAAEEERWAHGTHWLLLDFMVDHKAISDTVCENVYQRLGLVDPDSIEETGPIGPGWDLDEFKVVDKDGNIVLSDDKDMIGYIKYFLNMYESDNSSDSINWIFDMTVSEDKKEDYEKFLVTSYGVGYDPKTCDTPANRFQYCEYSMIIEPLFWFVPKHCSKTDAGVYVNCSLGMYFFGTISNWVEYASTKSCPDGTSWISEFTTYKLRSIVANSLKLDQDYTYGSLKVNAERDLCTPGKLNSSSGVMSDQKNVANSSTVNGYGLNIIDMNISQKDEDLDDGITSTWDRVSKIPNNPMIYKGRVSKDTQDEDGTVTTELIDTSYKIVKYYELVKYDKDGNITDILQPPNAEVGGADKPYPYYDNVEPGKIYIEDEGSWKVVDWFTRSDKNDSLTQEAIASSYPSYADFKENSPTINTGDRSTGSTIHITMKNSDNDYYKEDVLVVLLRKEDRPAETIDSDGNGLITESKITRVVSTSDDLGEETWGKYKFQFQVAAARDIHSGGTRVHIKDPITGGCSSSESSSSHGMSRVSGIGAGTKNNVWATFGRLHSLQNVEVEQKSGSRQVFKAVTKSGSLIGDEIKAFVDLKVGDNAKSYANESSWQLDAGASTNAGIAYYTTLWRGPVDTVTLSLYKKNAMDDTAYNNLKTILDAKNSNPTTRPYNHVEGQNLNINLGIRNSSLDVVSTCVTDPYHHPGGMQTDTKNVMCQVQTASKTWANTTALDFKADITTAIYAGEAKQQAKAIIKPISGFSVDYGGITSLKSAHFIKLQTSKIDFYPYIRMSFQVTADEYDGGNYSLRNILQTGKTPGYLKDRTVYILSDKKSSILPTNAVEVSWFNKTQNDGGYGLQMTSQQWSVHKRATDGSEKWRQANQVLPGGALYTLSTQGTETYLKSTTYSTYVDEPSRVWMTLSDTNKYTANSVITDNDNYITELKDVLEHFRLAQWTNKDYNLTTAWENPSTAVKVTTGGESLANLGLNITASTDTKYILQNGTPSNQALEGDIDILTETYVTTVYKCFTDVEGNVYMAWATGTPKQEKLTVAELNNMVNTIKSTCGTSLNVAYSNGITAQYQLIGTRKDSLGTIVQNLKTKYNSLYMLNLKTGLVDNVVNSVTRNKGNDYEAVWAMNDGRWYNEANDGIYVVAQTMTYKVGLGIPTKRVAALDPRLCPSQGSKGGIFTNAHLSQFRIDNKSTSANATGKDAGYLGTFDGMQVIVPEIENIYVSRPFYIPNANVQDLS